MATKTRSLYNNAYLSEGIDIDCCDRDSCKLIETIYSKVIASLDEAAQSMVPKIKSNFFKYTCGTRKWMFSKMNR